MTQLDSNGVPILDLGDASTEYVDAQQQAYLDSGDEAHLLTGAQVILDNPAPIDLDRPSVTTFIIGGETLDEALKSVVGAFDLHGRQPPQWVAATDTDLAELLAEHYDCPTRTMGEAQ